MKNLLKSILPPFIGFTVYFLVIRYSSVYFTLRIDQMGAGNLRSFMAFYRYLLPLLFAVAVLTQLLIVVPVWNKVMSRPRNRRIRAFIILVFVCVLFASGMGYAMWNPQDGTAHLATLIGFMSTVQILYWIMNFSVLYILD
jgi:hypothetical protein